MIPLLETHINTKTIFKPVDLSLFVPRQFHYSEAPTPDEIEPTHLFETYSHPAITAGKFFCLRLGWQVITGEFKTREISIPKYNGWDNVSVLGQCFYAPTAVQSIYSFGATRTTISSWQLAFDLCSTGITPEQIIEMFEVTSCIDQPQIREPTNRNISLVL